MKKRNYYLKKISNWLLPHLCIFCGERCILNDLCEACRADLPFSDLKKHPQFDNLYALFNYEPPVTKLIMNLKFGRSLVNAELLGQLLAEKIRQDWYLAKPLPEAIIPIPLHPQRLKERGFNQALEIARPLAKILTIPLAFQYCERIKPTLAQATLTAKKREQNIKGAFRVRKNLPYNHIAVLDDVITTGHTMKEFTSMLTMSGIKKIEIWSCAHARF